MVLQKKTSVADAEKLVSEYFQSGKSRKAFCQERGIKVGIVSLVDETPFVQITPIIQPVCTTPDDSEIVIDLKSGMRIRWRGKEIPASFYRLLETLNNGVVQ